MVKSDMGRTQIMGPGPLIFVEVTSILRAYYKTLVEKLGEEQAKEILVDVGRYAVKSDEELNSEAEEVMKKWLDSM